MNEEIIKINRTPETYTIEFRMETGKEVPERKVKKLWREFFGKAHAAIEGASETGVDILTAVRNIARGAVSGAAKVGGDITLTSVAAVEGALEAAGKVGVDTSKAVSSAVIGVIHAADNIGSQAGSTARKALLKAASLPRDVVEKAIGGSGKK